MLWIAHEGDMTQVDSAQAAIQPGRLDESNYGHDWVLVDFPTDSKKSAMRLAKEYDAAVNGGRTLRLEFPHPVTRWIVGRG